ncbi:MAG TPA: CoA-transferase [Anaerovoracaceae bacterium]|nr:CoA-transferase [Anaerovoracaceae bacterium]
MNKNSAVMTDSLKKKLMSADEAVRLISDGAAVHVAGTALVCSPAKIFKNIGESFLATGHPRDLCIISYGSPNTDVPGYNYFEYMTHKGLLKRVIGGHMGYHHPLFPLIRSNEVEGYNMSQGVMSIMMSEYVADKDGYLTKVGIRTQQDPRQEGCKLNVGLEMEDLVELRVVDGEEYLWYKMIRPDVVVLKASYADVNGNISFDAEPSDNDALVTAMAAKNHGGKVIVYVKALQEERFNPRLAAIPYFLVDAIVVDPDHVQAAPHLTYSPYFSNEKRASEEELRVILENETKNSVRKREIAQKVIARRAAMELFPDAVVNIGLGIPQMVSGEAISLGIDMSSVVMTTETGIIGGVQLPSVFGVSMNADSVYEQSSQFRFYEGGGLDIGILGALEADAAGNVNVCKKGPYLAGVGGFNFIVYSAKKLVFCFPFMRGSGYRSENEKLIAYDGKETKIVKQVECITMNADVEFNNHKTVYYITERCVFKLRESGLELIEIAPGLDLKKDVLDHLDFAPSVSEDLREMPAACFAVE